MTTSSRRSPLLVLAALAPLVLAAGAPAAAAGGGRAAPPAAAPVRAVVPLVPVVVPREPRSAVDLAFVAASRGYVVATQERMDRTGWWYRSVVVGGTSGVLSPVPDLDPRHRFLLAGHGLWEVAPGDGTAVLHDLDAGTSVSHGIGTASVAAASAEGLLLVPDSGTFALLRPDGSTVTAALAGHGVLNIGRAAVDGTRVLFTNEVSAGTTQVAIVDVVTGAFRRLSTSHRRVTGVALSPHSFLWLTEKKGTASLLHRLPRAGGADVVRPVTSTATAYSDWLTATDTAVLVRRHPPAGVRVTLVPADPARPYRDLPKAFWGAAGATAVDDGSFRTAVDGALSVAGVWRVRADGARTRVVTAVPTYASPGWLDLAGGQLRSSVSTGYGAGTSVYRRSVSGAGTPVLGPSVRTPLAVAPALEMSFSGLRGASQAPGSLPADPGVPPPHVVLTDASVRTGGYQAWVGSTLLVSGPYVASGTTVRGPSGAVLYTAPASASNLSIYGSRVVVALADGSVWMRDLAAAASTHATRLRAAACASGRCAVRVVAAADHVVWLTNPTTLVVRSLRTGATRTVARAREVDSRVVADDGVVAWRGFVLDLTDPAAQPVPMADDDPYVFAVDDHWVAWNDEWDRAVVARLPFGGPHRPRLLGVVAPASFSPADGRVWRPRIDLSKPVTGVTLTIRRGGTTVRTLTSSSAYGSIRGLVWDGRTTTGARAAAGAYTWTLTASAADGEGTVVGLDGTTPVRGTVTVT